MMTLLVGLSVVTCGSGPSGTGTLVAGACPLSDTTGVLTADGDRLDIGDQPVRWPSGWTVHREAGRLVISDHGGTMRAGAGDMVRIGGGRVDDNTWLACSDIRVLSPSAPADSAD